MTTFLNLVEAISYHKNCYICNGQLQFYIHDELGKIQADIEQGTISKSICINLSDGMDSDTDDFLIVDMITNKASIKRNYRYAHSSDSVGHNYTRRSRKLNISLRDWYDGLIYESVNLSCNDCQQFSYTIQMVVNTKEEYVTKLFLNSEYICLEENGSIVHEINNNYAREITGYRKIAQLNSDDQKIEIPLIALNLQNPRETIERIKKLVIFS
jgi:hypothetical protein